MSAEKNQNKHSKFDTKFVIRHCRNDMIHTKVRDCGDKCDVCSDPKGVKKKLEGYQAFLVQKEGNSRLGSGALVITNGDNGDDIDSDLYEGGRRG